MKDLVIYLTAAGPNVYAPTIDQTIDSLIENIGCENYEWFFAVDKKDTAKHLEKKIDSSTIRGIRVNNESWAHNFNKFTDEVSSDYKYVLISHDDLCLNTPGLFIKSMEEIKGAKEEIGWVTYTNTHYYSVNVHVSTRAGFYKDGAGRHIFECSKKEKIYPKKAVKVFGPYTHLNLISFSALKKLGHTPDWTKYTMLIDEHWCLQSVFKNLTNIWVPYIFYKHPNWKFRGTRRVGLRFESAAHKKFTERWGVKLPFPRSYIDRIIKRFPQFSYLAGYSYDYQYLTKE
jgi:hypothetical protein